MLGNERTIERIRKDISAGYLSHAYLFSGEKGMGKKSLSEILCLSLFCKEKSGGEPCRTCPDCKKVLSGNHPDILRVVHEKPDLYRVDEIREQVCDTVEIRPYEGARKVYIIEEAQKMAPQAQNALLKTLEEPPAFVTILLLCDDETKLLETVKSRCVKVRMEPVPDPMIHRLLLTECGADPETADICTAFARGNAGLAQSLCRDEDFKSLYRKVINLCRNLSSMDAGSMLEFGKEFAADGSSYEDFFSLLSLWCRDVLMTGLSGDGGLTFQNERGALRAQAGKMSPEKVTKILSAIETASRRIKANVNKELTLELLLSNIKDISNL